MQQVGEVVQDLSLEPNQVERIKTAVAEATMNAMEHGNKYQPDMPVDIEVRVSDALLSICITDMGGSELIPTPDTPNLEAKLEGVQSPRGWGLFLIQNMVDKMNIIRDESHHTVELIVYLEGDKHGS
jgi:anti-sigma regulatory factor (Ser/Thr protein kinase)